MFSPPQGRSLRLARELGHVREPQPLHFPEEEEVPEGKRHLELRTFLFQLLRFALGPAHSVGSDQFVYWNASDPRRKLSPDAFVKLDVPDAPFGSWKTWERYGPPDLAVEIVSPTEGEGVPWEEKLDRYQECGVPEVVRFDPEADEGQRLRVWDRIDEDLVERVVVDDRTACITLGLHWAVGAIRGDPVGLRLVRDDGSPVLSELEAEAKAREAAEARVGELEAELAKLRGSTS